jgi:hypothetical protein
MKVIPFNGIRSPHSVLNSQCSNMVDSKDVSELEKVDLHHEHQKDVPVQDRATIRSPTQKWADEAAGRIVRVTKESWKGVPDLVSSKSGVLHNLVRDCHQIFNKAPYRIFLELQAG